MPTWRSAGSTPNSSSAARLHSMSRARGRRSRRMSRARSASTSERAAEGILTLTNASLAAAIRLSLFEKGLDPREFSLLSFGGAGGLHAIPVADELGIDRGDLPCGCEHVLGLRHSAFRHRARPREEPRYARRFRTACPRSRAPAPSCGARARACSTRTASRRRRGELGLSRRHALPRPGLRAGGAVERRALRRRGARPAYRRFPRAAPAALLLRQPGRPGGDRHPACDCDRAAAPRQGGADHCFPPARRGRLRRRVFLDGAWREIDILHRAELREPLAGPALVEEEYTTVFVADGWTCGPEEGGDLVARRSGQARRNPDEA